MLTIYHASDESSGGYYALNLEGGPCQFSLVLTMNWKSTGELSHTVPLDKKFMFDQLVKSIRAAMEPPGTDEQDVDFTREVDGCPVQHLHGKFYRTVAEDGSYDSRWIGVFLHAVNYKKVEEDDGIHENFMIDNHRQYEMRIDRLDADSLRESLSEYSKHMVD